MSNDAPKKKTIRHFMLCGVIAFPLLLWYFWEPLQIEWKFFLLRSQKAEVGDTAREFLVAHQQAKKLVQKLKSTPLNVRRQASFAMHQLWQNPDTREAIPFLLEFVKNEQEDLKVRWHSIRALGYLRVSNSAPLLIETLIQEDILCPNPTCRQYHLWEESHQALERIFEVQQEFKPEQGKEHRLRIAKNWKKLWEKFLGDSLKQEKK